MHVGSVRVQRHHSLENWTRTSLAVLPSSKPAETKAEDTALQDALEKLDQLKAAVVDARMDLDSTAQMSDRVVAMAKNALEAALSAQTKQQAVVDELGKNTQSVTTMSHAEADKKRALAL